MCCCVVAVLDVVAVVDVVVVGFAAPVLRLLLWIGTWWLRWGGGVGVVGVVVRCVVVLLCVRVTFPARDNVCCC